uniref:Uncharacterized protein n=1 Tax=Arion vulgaris TaxID=1028688 RepID=A0A0B7BEQ4_9EUPU
MPRLFVVFRTFDRIWACKTYTRELAPFEMDMSRGPIKLMFMVEQISAESNSENLLVLDANFMSHNSILSSDTASFYCHAHENFVPVFLKQNKQKPIPISPTVGTKKGLVRRFSVPNLELDIEGSVSGQSQSRDVIYFVLPMFRSTILVDAHLASCINSEYSKSRVFRRHFWHYICKNNGFRNCVPDYEKWTQEERNTWENYLSVPYMIDLVAVWPKQKIDYAWSMRMLDQLSKHVALEEGFAWLSTLGGAHSSLGETFIHHAEQAGRISSQQLKLAIELGNESLMARCYIFWSWSLLQRGHLRRCQICVQYTWKFCQIIRSRDTALENMCKAVWSRLKYKRAQLKAKSRLCMTRKSRPPLDNDDKNGGGDTSNNTSGNSVFTCGCNSNSSYGDINSKSSSNVCIETAVKSQPAVTNSLRVH